MFLKISSWVFILSGFLFAISIIVQKTLICNLKDHLFAAKYVETIVWLLAFYILGAFLLVIAIKDPLNELLMLLFGLSPFIIGNFASYKKETTFSIIQILTSILSAGYVLYFYILK